MIREVSTEIRCRYCGKTVAEATGPCGYNEPEANRSGGLGHVFVHPDSPGWKRHPFTQYAATLFELVRMCHKCGALVREGEGVDGKKREYTNEDQREHWRGCSREDGGVAGSASGGRQPTG